MRTVVTTKSGSVYTIRRTIDEKGDEHFFLSANNVPNANFDKLADFIETEIYRPRIITTDRDPAPLPDGLPWYDAVGYRLNFIEVMPRTVNLFPHGEIVCSRAREIVSDEIG